MVSKADNIVEVPDIKIPGLNVYKNEQEWDLILENYFSRIAAQASTVDPSPESGRIGLDDFFDLVRNVIISRQNSEGIPADHRLLYLEEESPEEVDTEAITFELARREPGSYSQGPMGQGRIKEVTPHFRSQIKDPDRPGEQLTTMGKYYDNWVTFYVYARTNKQARKRLFWFENVMQSFDWYFGLFGSRAIYDGVGRRESYKIGELKLTRYPVTYGVRTDDTFQVSRQELRHLALSLNVSRN